jgi:hypothetical protein
MDLTTLTAAVLVALALLVTDAAVHAGSVELEVEVAPKIENVSLDKGTLEVEFQHRLEEIISIPSVVPPPEIRSRRDQGVGMALAEMVNAREIVYALQRQVGYDSDYIRFALLVEDGKVQGSVSGHSHLVGNFTRVISRNEGESIQALIQRSCLWGATQLAPYYAGIFMLQQGAVDNDFSEVIALAQHAKAVLPPTPTSYDRSLFDNLLGLVALFQKDAKAARTAFDTAIADDPTNPLPFLNAALTDVQLADYQKAADRMDDLVRLARPSDKILLGTAYMIWGAALFELHDRDGADRMLATSTRINPYSSIAFALWADHKKLEDNTAEAERLYRMAREASTSIENYAGVAALYFRLAVSEVPPLTRTRFANPKVLTLH